MRFTALILAASLLASPSIVHAESLADHRIRIETHYQSGIADCRKQEKAERASCIKTVRASRKAAYNQAWANRDPAALSRSYPGNLDTSKPRILKDYQADAAFCKELTKAEAATCLHELLERKKLTLKAVTTAPK